MGKDAAVGKLTWVAIHGLEASRTQAAELLEQAEDALAPLGPAAESLRELGRYIVHRRH